MELDSNKIPTVSKKKKKIETSKGNVTEWVIGDVKKDSAFAGSDTPGVMFFKIILFKRFIMEYLWMKYDTLDLL